MKKQTFIKSIILVLICGFASAALASTDKVLQIFKNGTVVEEYNLEDIDYIEINDVMSAPSGVHANTEKQGITITWDEIEGATYDVYRSSDNSNFSLLATDITETTYTDVHPIAGANYYKVKAVIDGVSTGFSSVVASTWDNVSESGNGFYIGINGFNNRLYSYPIMFLSDDASTGFDSFIDGLTLLDGTRLYNVVGKSIDDLQAATYPENLSEVAIVTFTDGLDRGSLDWTDDFMTLTEYLTSLNNRLTNEFVSGQKISSYSVGVCGDDAKYNIASFRNNLQKLATSSNNVFEVNNMAEVNEAFMNIANFLSETKYIQTFQMKIYGLSHNEKSRYTFDNVTSHNSSKQYIEGTFNRKDRTLTDIKYVGLTSSSGSVVTGEFVEDSETGRKMYIFKFENLKSLDGTAIPVDNVQHWFTEEGYWNHDEEFTFDPGDIGLEKIKRSAAIILNLDCSSSLGEDDFKSLKESAKLFIKTIVDNAVDTKEVASVSLDRTAVTLPAGGTSTLKATVLPVTALKKDVKWTSTNPEVASVDESGKITAHKPGTATIVVTTVDGGFTATCQVTVVTYVANITLNHGSMQLYNGDNATLSVSVLPENANNKEVSFNSSNPSVASVDELGNISAKTAGVATITVSAKDGSGKSATCQVTVLQHVASVTLSNSTLTLGVGTQQQLSATVNPANASDKQVTWKTSNESVATVDINGLVSAVGKGTAQITATSREGNKTAVCNIEVRQYVNSITMNSSMQLYNGDNATLSVSVLPENANNKEVSFNSSNPSVASVDELGNISAKTAGVATITVSAKDGSGKSATCQVTVLQHVASVTLSNSTLTLGVGTQQQLSATVNPANASDKQVTWKTSNESVATVDINGLVSAVGKGTAQITATSREGNKAAVCNIEVRQYVNSITMDRASASLNIGGTLQLNATVNPADANEKSLLWSSSNASVASVSQNGLVNGLATGTTVITATSKDGTAVKGSCTITVKQPVSAISLNNSAMNLNLGSSGTLTVTVSPSNASNKNFSVRSSDTSIATVTKSGQSVIISAIRLGTSKITVTSEDGSHEATCDVTVSLSTTPINLALAVKKSGKRYYIPLSSYTASLTTGYTKEGITLSSGSTSFILAFNNATSSAKTFSEANALGTLPTQTQANVIVQNWSSLNTALQTYGGTSLGSNSYWTSTESSTSRSAYSYSSSGVGSVAAQRTCYVRCIVATL